MLSARVSCWIAALQLVALPLVTSSAADSLPRSMLVLEQSDVRGLLYAAIFSGLRSEVNATAKSPITIYVENLDLSRFNGPEYEESLRRHFQVKYRDRPIGVVVPVGAAALDYALRWRSELWPDAPVVFAFADETSIAKSNLPRGVTGRTTRLSLADMVAAARAIVPGLAHIAIVGDRFETQTAFAHLKNELPRLAAELDVIDLTGLPFAKLRERVSALPDETAILYTAIYSDGAGTYFPPADALAMFAEAANRPIIAPLESYIGRGAVGGYAAIPAVIGQEAAQTALQIIEGTSPAAIPVAPGNSLRPVFDWRELQRWHIDERKLPPGSEVRYRVLPLWQEYPRQFAALSAVLLLQSGLVVALLYERQRRRRAEVDSHARINELAHMNRRATAGELTASIAHELNQPLGAILFGAETAEQLLQSPSPDLGEIKEILADIRRDDLRASEVIIRLRRLLDKAQLDVQEVDLNHMIEEVFDFVSVQASNNNVDLNKVLTSESLSVRGDPIQLQQVVLNLVMNGIDAVRTCADGERQVTGSTTRLDDTTAELSILDTGPGIPSGNLKRIFEPFFTTKNHGMGMGLTIARTIVESHGGSIQAANQRDSGAGFHIKLPLAHFGAG